MICPFCGEDTLLSNGLRLHADQFDKFGFALTPAYMCDACKKVILDTYVADGE